MSFVAQVDLADVAPYDSEGVLPLDGVLSFFYEAIIQRAWGFDPGDRGSAAVIYTPAGAGAERREAPADLATDGVFKAAGLRPEPELTFAPWDSSDIERLDLGRDEGVAYDELLEELLEIDDGKTNRLLGHPDPIQGDMQLKCQLVTNGLYCGNSSGYHDPRAEELLDGATQWRLLLQVDSQREAGMMWGDLGRLYYWIKQQDLENGAWEESWLILQCG